jgi:uncharacterized protein YodC (DUF2158 family)
MKAIKHGTVVQLRSGGPRMTALTDRGDGHWYCIWFSGQQIEGYPFKPAELRRVRLWWFL